jgi:hypothetical protein
VQPARTGKTFVFPHGMRETAGLVWCVRFETSNSSIRLIALSRTIAYCLPNMRPKVKLCLPISSRDKNYRFAEAVD